MVHRVKVAGLMPAAQVSERQFYDRTRAFGRFGMRVFKPVCMNMPHSHGHIELNYAKHCRLHYVLDGETVVVEPEQLVMFWAGVPHQLMKVEVLDNGEYELCNLYLPLDMFLFMPYVHQLQVAMLTGGMVSIAPELCAERDMLRWLADYRANKPERVDVLKMELNTLFRRMLLVPLSYLRKPWQDGADKAGLASAHVRHVVSMVQHVLDHLDQPLRNADVTQVTGLHVNYALALFSKTMLIPLKQFVIRMRLLRARSLLLESNTAIVTVANSCGFSSMSQFYAQFATAYGTSPQQLRVKYLAG
jgi:AraC family transcriptional regulator, melibiose operon regulatory protein